MVTQIMTPAAFDNNHKLVEPHASGNEEHGDEGLTMPEGTSVQEHMAWVSALPEREPLTYLGLPANAEKLLLMNHGQSTISDVRYISNLLEEGEQIMAEATEAVSG